MAVPLGRVDPDGSGKHRLDKFIFHPSVPVGVGLEETSVVYKGPLPAIG